MYSLKYKDQLNDDILKDVLTVKNYRDKFHHLLCHEEEEHAHQLAKRYLYSISYKSNNNDIIIIY